MQTDIHTGNDAFFAACLAATKAKPKASGALQTGQLFSVGQRDTDFTSLAGYFRSRGAHREEIITYLNAIDGVISNPHGIENLERVGGSVARYEIKPDVFTHDRFAKMLAKELKETVRYCAGQGFLVYDGCIWKRDSEGLSVTHKVRVMLDLVRASIEQLKAQMEPDEFKKLQKAAKKLEAASFMRESLSLLKTDPSIAISFGDFDRQRHLLSFTNGTLNLNTMELQPFCSEDLLTLKLDFDYNDKADCPLFTKFMSEILSPEVSSFVLRVFGYALEGHGREQAYFICHGSGKNGKSTLMETASMIFGPHLITMQPETLNGKKDGQIRNDLARLADKRIMLTSETRHGTVLDAPLLKQITGQDVLAARYLHKEYFEFRPCCVPVIVTNYLPVMDGGDMAMSRRLHIIKFDRVIDKVDTSLPQKLLAEKAGILNLMLQGLRDYRANGLAVPDSIKNHSQEFMKSSNLIQGFVDDSLEALDGAKLYSSQLYRKYESWCTSNGYKPMSMNQLKESLNRCIGCEQERDASGRYWPNLRLKFNL